MERHKKTDLFFDEKEAATPPPHLSGRIMGLVRAEKKLEAARKRAAYFVFALICSVVALAGAFLSLEGALVRAEVFKILSVIFSDPLAAAANWQSFVLFLLESLPVDYLIVFLAALLALLESLKYVAKYASVLPGAKQSG